MNSQQIPQEWQRLAWAIAAHDLAIDIPEDPHAVDPGEASFADWAESEPYGSQARQFIAVHDALQTIRFGPETSPTPLNPYAIVDTTPDTAEHFARTVQHIVRTYPETPSRAALLADAAIAYAGQVIPGGIAFPSTPVTEVAVTGESFRTDQGYYFALIEEGVPGMIAHRDRFDTVQDARTAADHWNTAAGVQVEDLLRVAEGVQGVQL